MINAPLSITRRHVLGELYSRCDAVTENVPVYIAAGEGVENAGLVGYVDQSLGHYADAFTFHLSPEICKQLSAGYYSYSFEYEFSDPTLSTPRSRVRLTTISLVSRQSYTKPVPRGTLSREEDTGAIAA